MGLSKRILMKTCTYKTMSILSSLGFAYLITGSWKLAGGVALFEAIGKVLLYVVHEWLWERNNESITGNVGTQQRNWGLRSKTRDPNADYNVL